MGHHQTASYSWPTAESEVVDYIQASRPEQAHIPIFLYGSLFASLSFWPRSMLFFHFAFCHISGSSAVYLVI